MPMYGIYDDIDSKTIKFLNAMEAYVNDYDFDILSAALESGGGDITSTSNAVTVFKNGNPDDAISQMKESLKIANSEKKKGNYKKVIAISLGVMSVAIIIATVIIKKRTGKFPPQLITKWVKHKAEIKKGKAELADAEKALNLANATVEDIMKENYTIDEISSHSKRLYTAMNQATTAQGKVADIKLKYGF